MHDSLGRGRGADGARPPLMSRALALVFAASFGAMWSFYLLLSVVPR